MFEPVFQAYSAAITVIGQNRSYGNLLGYGRLSRRNVALDTIKGHGGMRERSPPCG